MPNVSTMNELIDMSASVVQVIKAMVLHVDTNVSCKISRGIFISDLDLDSCVENTTICSESAACVYDPILQDNICSCREGFVGDGIQ